MRLRRFWIVGISGAVVLLLGAFAALLFFISSSLTFVPGARVLERFVPADSFLVIGADLVDLDMSASDSFVVSFAAKYVPVIDLIAEPKKVVVSFQSDEDGAPRASFVAVVSDSAAVEQYINSTYSVVDTDARGALIFERENEYGAFYNNVLVVTSSRFRRDSVIGRSGAKRDSIVRSLNFLRTITKLPRAHNAYVYIDPSYDSPPLTPFLGMRSLARGIAIGITQDSDSITADIITVLDRKALAKNDLTALLKPSNIYLDSRITAGSPMFYMEFRGLKEILDIQRDLLLADTEVSELFGDSLRSLNFSALQPFEGNAALLIEDSGGVIPTVSLVIDVKGQSAAALAFDSSIDEKMEKFISTARLALDAPEDFYLEKLENENGFNGIRLYPKKFPQSEFHIPLLEELNENIELWYGVTPDELFVITTKKPAASSSAIASNMMYQALLPYLGKFSKTERTFFDPAVTNVWLEKFTKFADESGYLPESQKQTIIQLSGILQNLRSAVSGTKVSGSTIKTRVFLRQ